MRVSKNTFVDLIIYCSYSFCFLSYLAGWLSIFIPLMGLLLVLLLSTKEIKVSQLGLALGFLVIIFSFGNIFRIEAFFNLLYGNLIFCILIILTAFTFEKRVSTAYISVFRIMVFVSALIGLYQVFFEPTLFGISNFKGSTEQTWGTTTFRLSGLLGSPQHNAFIFSVGLWLVLTIDNKIWKAFYFSVIVFSGLLTLSTFFGLSLVMWVILCFPIVLFFCIPLAIYFDPIGFDYRNTSLESFSFFEISNVWERLTYQTFTLSPETALFGHGLGQASQGVIDRQLITQSKLESESSIIIFFYERGLLGMVSLIYLVSWFLQRLTMDKWFVMVLVTFILSAAVVPVLSSPRGLLYLLPFLLYTTSLKNE